MKPPVHQAPARTKRSRLSPRRPARPHQFTPDRRPCSPGHASPTATEDALLRRSARDVFRRKSNDDARPLHASDGTDPHTQPGNRKELVLRPYRQRFCQRVATPSERGVLLNQTHLTRLPSPSGPRPLPTPRNRLIEPPMVVRRLKDLPARHRVADPRIRGKRFCRIRRAGPCPGRGMDRDSTTTI